MAVKGLPNSHHLSCSIHLEICRKNVACHGDWTGGTMGEMLLEVSGLRPGMLTFLPCIIPFYITENCAAQSATYTPFLRNVFPLNRNCGKLGLAWLTESEEPKRHG